MTSNSLLLWAGWARFPFAEIPSDAVGEMIVVRDFLASDGASFVNGHDFVIDGGLTTNVMGWTGGLALRAELAAATKAAAAG